MGESESRKDVFAWFGSAIYAGQLFETELVTMLLCYKRLEKPSTSIAELDDLDERLSKRTLGQLIHEVRKSVDIPADIEKRFFECLDKRNYLAHSYFYINSRKMNTVEGCDELISELSEIYSELRDIDKIASEISAKYRMQAGIDEDELQKQVALELGGSLV